VAAGPVQRHPPFVGYTERLHLRVGLPSGSWSGVATPTCFA
jgi:hypothetical protein